MTMRIARPLILLTLVVSLAVPAQAGVLELEVVAATATPHEWLPQGVMLDVFPSALSSMHPVGNHAGHIAFATGLRGQNVMFNVNDAALFRRTPDGATTMLLRKGDQAAGAPEGAVWFEFLPTCLAEDGTLFFRGQLDSVNGGGGVTLDNDVVVGRIAPDGTVTIVMREGQSVPGLGGYAFTSYQVHPAGFFQPRCTADGTAITAHSISLAGSDEYALLGIDSLGTPSVIYRTGDAAPGFELKEEFLGFGGDHRVNAAGQPVFSSVLQTGDGGQPVPSGKDSAFFGPGIEGETTRLFQEGDAAPGSPNGFFQDLDNKDYRTIDGDGNVYVIADYKYDNWYIEEALYKHDPAAPGVITPLLVQNTPAPGFEGEWNTGSLSGLLVNGPGRVSVVGKVWSGQDDWGDPLLEAETIWIGNDAGELVPAITTGDETPGTGGALLQTLNDQMYMNLSGQTLFAGSLKPQEPVTTLNDYCVFRYTPDVGVELFIREGVTVTIEDGDERTTGSISLTSYYDYGAGGEDGMPIALRNDGTALFRLGFLGDAPQPGFSANRAIVIGTLLPDPCDPDTVNCDDEDACTEDTCTPETGCINTPIVCDDADACTTDSCDTVEGCLYEALSCDDGNLCTEDGCDAELGCQYADFDCDDGDACTDDACESDTGCVYQQVDCDDADACTTDSCDAVEGCLHAALDCDDADACTTDSCDAADGCVHDALDCDDANACTTDSCDAELGCQHADVACDDEDACTIDNCSPEVGCEFAPVDCDDGSVCTDDSCDTVLGCQYANVECGDDDACTEDLCDPLEGCQNSPVDCADTDACTEDTCDAALGCQHEAVVCDDEDACTTDFCNKETGCEFTDLECDDNVACTIDSCDPEVGCVHTDIVCNDDSPCTLDTCELGECVFTKDPEKPNCCVKVADCYDGDPCTVETCVEQLCNYAAVEDCCSKDMDCNDGDVCTVDLCDQQTNECKSQAMAGCCMVDADCDAGQICVEHECLDPFCLPCEDDEDCTADGDACVALASGNYCLPTCDGGCPDGSECLSDACVPDQGDCECVEEPVAYGCDAGNWTRFDTCGQAVELVEECNYECADLDGCCEFGEAVAAGKCGGEAFPEAPETDVVTTEDVTEPVEEVVATPDTTPEADLPATEDDLGNVDPGDDLGTTGAEVVEDDGGKGGGGGGCSTTGAPSFAGWLLLALLALLALARRRSHGISL